jgi:hypothetical protein
MYVDKRLRKVCHPTACNLYGFAERRAQEKADAAQTGEAAAIIPLVWNDSYLSSSLISAPFVKERSHDGNAPFSIAVSENRTIRNGDASKIVLR